MNKIIKKMTIATVSLSLVVGLFIANPVSLKAQTTSLSQLVELLISVGIITPDKAQAARLAVASVPTQSQSYTLDLTIGSTGTDVTRLQQFLGVTPATGYFGSLTKAAVQQYQASHGIPSTGYFGPLTRASVNSTMVATTPVVITTPIVTNPSTPIINTGASEGFIDDLNKLSSLSSEKVGENEKNVKVLGIEMTANGADQSVERLIVQIDTPTGRDRLDRFVSDVSVWLNNEKIGTMSVDRSSRDRTANRYTFRFTGLNGVIKKDKTANLYVTVTGIRNLDSADIGDGWNVTVPANGIRVVSPNGVDDFYSNTSFMEDFSLETFASANDVELRTNLAGNNPKEGVVIGKDNGDFDATLLEFTFEAKGSDITINDLPINVTSFGASVGDMMNELTLKWNGEDKAKQISGSASSATVLFDNLDLTIREGDKVTFSVVANMNKVDGTTFAEGDYVSASTSVDNINADDESGEQLGAGDLRGSVSGEYQHFYSVAPEVEVLSTSITPIDNGNSAPEAATAKIKVRLTARGGTIYLNGSNESDETKRFFLALVDHGDELTQASSTNYTVAGGKYTVTNSGAEDEYYTVNENNSITIEIVAIVSQGTVTTDTILAGLKAGAVQFGTSPSSDTTRSATSLNWSRLTDEFHSGVTPLVNPS